MKKKICLVALTLIMVLAVHTVTYAFNEKVHTEIAVRAGKYMESDIETPNQKAAWEWIKGRYDYKNIPYGAVQFDYMNNFCLSAAWGTIHNRYIDIPGRGRYDFSTFGHFLDIPSTRNPSWTHPAHHGKSGGIHNDIDGYNYARHPRPYFAADADDAVATVLGLAYFCPGHSGYLLDIVEGNQGGVDDFGKPITSNNNGCYVNSYPYWYYPNLIFPPVDNLGNACYGYAVSFKNDKLLAPLNLGFSCHAVGDCAAFFHVNNNMGWGHAELETWADAWVERHGKDWFSVYKVKESITYDFYVDGIDPAKRDVKWLVTRLATFAYEFGKPVVWDNYPDPGKEDAKSEQYMKYIGPKAVACMVIIQEKYYNNCH
jgi:hypothetical protein